MLRQVGLFAQRSTASLLSNARKPNLLKRFNACDLVPEPDIDTLRRRRQKPTKLLFSSYPVVEKPIPLYGVFFNSVIFFDAQKSQANITYPWFQNWVKNQLPIIVPDKLNLNLCNTPRIA